MKIINFKNKGFTLVETLVAITILMISIVGPLTIAQKSLMSATLAKDQVIASFLAQDTIEEIKNKRDFLIIKDISINSDTLDQLYGDSVECKTNVCQLYIQADGTYGVDDKDANGRNNTISKFLKKILIEQGPSNDNEFIVTVTIYWNTGTIENQVKIVNVIYNIKL